MKWLSRNRKLHPLDAYNRWAGSYWHESNPIKNFSDELILKSLINAKGKTIMDAGCGAGKICQMAQEHGAAKIVGIDFSEKMIEEAKKNCSNGEFKCLDLSKAKIEGQFDIVICALVLGHIKDLDFALTNLLENILPNGQLLITDFHPYLTLQGNRRTFKETISGKAYEVEHYLYLFEEYFSIIAKSNAYVEELVEPAWQDQPVIFGMKIRKK